MVVNKNLSWGFVVLALGIGAALVFRKNTAETYEHSSQPRTSPRETALPRRVLTDPDEVTIEEPIQQVHSRRTALAVTPAPSRMMSALNDAPPPPTEALELPSSFAEQNARNSGSRKHLIRDGDTLSRLAEKYLGSADHMQEIFELNRELLTDPDLLPIGKTLKIPAMNAPPVRINQPRLLKVVPIPNERIGS